MARFQKALAQLMRQEEGEQPPAPNRSAAASSVISDLQTRVSSEELALVSAFAKAFLPNARLLESSLSAAQVSGLTLGACRFLCDRLSLPWTVRVYVPNIAEHGWHSECAVLEIATDNQPGLVNSICGVVEQLGAGIESLVSATAQVERDATGLALRIAPGNGESDECLIHIQMQGVDNPAALENAIRRHLEAMGRNRQEAGSLGDELLRIAETLSTGSERDREAGELLSWLNEGRFTPAGIEEIAADGSSARSLGIYLESPEGLETVWDGSIAEGNVALLKTGAADPVNVGEYLDEVRIRLTDPDEDQPSGFRIAGRLAAQAFRERAGGAPLARELCKEALESLRRNDTSDIDAAARIFDGLPIDVVLAVDRAEIPKMLDLISSSDQQPGFRVLVSPAKSDGTAISFLTIVAPRQHLARNDAERVARIVREHAPILARHFVGDDLSVARLHYTLGLAAEKLRPEAIEDVVSQIRKLLSSWREAPVVDHATDTAPVPPAVPTPGPSTEPSSDDAPPTGVEIRPDQTSARRFTLRVATGGEPGAFNRLMSSLDNLGLRILRHHADPSPGVGETHEIAVELGGDGKVEPVALGELIEAMDNGTAESDTLCSLCWRAGLGAASIDVLRGLAALADIDGVTNRRDVHRTLIENVDATKALMRAFEVKFDPRLALVNENQRGRDLTTALSVFRSAVDGVKRRGDARILRALGRIFESTVRCSFFRGDRHQPGRAIAFKLERPELESGRHETYVYAPSFEGLALRRGLAARTQVHMVDELATLPAACLRTLDDQTVRARFISTDPGAATIAIKGPVGDADRTDKALRAFVEAVFDLTDNVVGGELHRDPDVIAYDEADSYCCFLVADRPTGFADIARQVIQERSFWMGDAAITRFDTRVASEGAWAGLQGLLEADRNREVPLTVVAIGSPHELRLPAGVRLVAAFDEHEIFLDPGADAKKSAEALAKLGRQETSSWNEFPLDLRERGSIIVQRTTRKLELTPEARELLHYNEDSGEVADLLRAILEYEADLLWVAAPHATARRDHDTGAQPTDRIAIDVGRVGARSVAEIGHELFSPAARVAFAIAGGIVHTPPFDGLAGDLLADRVSNVDLAVDLAGPLREGVEAYSAEVAAAIRRNALETPARERAAVELDQERSKLDWVPAATTLRSLGDGPRSGILRRYDLSEVELVRRGAASTGLTRPEVAVVRAAVGLDLQHVIRGSSLCEDPYIRPWVDEYFPAPIAESSPGLIDQHPLRYEIAALATSEKILEIMGFAFVADAAQTHGRPQLDIVKAWCAATIFGGAQEVWAEVEDSDITLGSADHRRHRRTISSALERATRRIVELRAADLSLEKIMDRLAAGVGEILRSWPETLPDSLQARHEDAIDLGVRTGLGRIAADHLARFSHLADIIDICDLAIQINSPRSTIATVFLGLDPLFRFREMDEMVATFGRQDPVWGERAAAHLRGRLSAARRGLATEVVSHAAGRRQPIERYVEAHRDEIQAFQSMIGEVESGGQASIAAVEVLLGSLENLTRGQRRSW